MHKNKFRQSFITCLRTDKYRIFLESGLSIHYNNLSDRERPRNRLVRPAAPTVFKGWARINI